MFNISQVCHKYCFQYNYYKIFKFPVHRLTWVMLVASAACLSPRKKTHLPLESTPTSPSPPARNCHCLKKKPTVRLSHPILTCYQIELPSKFIQHGKKDSSMRKYGASYFSERSTAHYSNNDQLRDDIEEPFDCVSPEQVARSE